MKNERLSFEKFRIEPEATDNIATVRQAGSAQPAQMHLMSSWCRAEQSGELRRHAVGLRCHPASGLLLVAAGLAGSALERLSARLVTK